MRDNGRLFRAMTTAAIRDQAKGDTGVSWMRQVAEIRNLPEVKR
jgi:hypothetical protein